MNNPYSILRHRSCGAVEPSGMVRKANRSMNTGLLPRLKSFLLCMMFATGMTVVFSDGLYAQTTATFNANGTFTVPAGVTSLNIKAWGAGGNGANGAAKNGGGGGGGGAYVTHSTYSTSGGTQYSIVTGTGGGTTGSDGTSNTTINTNLFVAAGGTSAVSTAGGAGGTTGNSLFPGGGSSTAGGNGAPNSGKDGGNGGNAAGGGGTGGAGGIDGKNGSAAGGGNPPGGGGGGGAKGGLGAAGSAGGVTFSWTCPTYNLTGTSASSPICTGNSSVITLISSAANLPVGIYTVTYDLSAPNAATGNTAILNVSTAGSGTFTTTALINSGPTTVTVTNLQSGSGAGCSSLISTNRTATITVNATPSITGTSPGAICGAGSVSISASASAGTINWYAASTGGSSLGTGAAFTTPVLSSSTTYYVDATTGACTSTPRIAVLASIIPPPSITAGGGGTFCYGSDIALTSSGTNLTNQYWQGPDSFYSLLQNPTLSAVTTAMSGTYTVTGSSLSGINLVANGDFEAGNTGFGSSYFVSTDLVPEGRYAVVANPNSVHTGFTNCVNHTPAGTLQMVINGAVTAGVNVWSQTVNVVPGTDYQFTYWVQSVVASNPSQLQLYVNGVAAGPTYTANLATCSWKQFTYNWPSGASTTADLSLVNQNIIAGGNDFTLDDIVFQQTCSATSSVDVTVNADVTAGAIGSTQSICRGFTPAPLTSVTDGTGSGTISYEWQTNASGSFVTISGATSATYSPPALTATTSYQRRTVSLSGGTTCYSPYTTQITITVTGPTAVAGGPDTVCQAATPAAITLSGASFSGGATTAAWSIISGGGTLSSTAQTATPATVTYTPAANYSGTVILRLTTNVVGCAAIAERTINITPTVGTPVFTLGATSTRCQGAGSVTYTATATNNTGITYTLDAVSITGGNSIVAGTGAVNYTDTWSGTTTITASAAGCNGPTTAMHTVTINPNLPVSISIDPSINPLCLGNPVTFTATPTNGGTTPDYQWKVNGTNAGTNSATYSYTPVNNDAVTCVLTSNASPCATGNPATSNTLILTVNVCINKWKGAVSTDWNTAGNWITYTVPAVDADIIFDDVPVNHCLLDQDRSVTDITNAQATYRMVTNGYKLTVKGNLNFTGGAQIDASAAGSSVEFAGAANQSIPAGAFYADEVYNLAVNNANDVTLYGTLRLLNTLTATSGRLDAATNSPSVIYAGTAAQTIESSSYLNDLVYNLTVDNGSGVTLNTNFILTNNLVINSGKSFSIAAVNSLTVTGAITNSSGNAGFVLKSDATGTASLIHDTNNVPATVQRYISGVAEAWHFLSSPVAAQGISGSWLPAGTYGNGTGYDLYVWNEPTSCWIYKLDLTSVVNWNTVHPGSNFTPGRGYLYSVQAANPTKEFAGDLNHGPISHDLTFPGTDVSLTGFSLVGNPYPSSIDWQAASGWTRPNLVSSGGGYDMWIWNPTAANYGVFNSFTGTGTNDVTRYIAPMQGYFVRAESAGTLGMDNAVRVHDGAGGWKSAKINPEMIRLVVQSGTDHSFDEAQILFGYAANQSGASKLFSPVVTAPSLYLPSGGENYSVRYLTDTIENRRIPVMFKAGRNGNYTLTCNFDEDRFETVMLEDRQTKDITNLKSARTYDFTASKTDHENRFVLHFGPVTNQSDHAFPAGIYTDGIRLIVDLTLISKETDVFVYDIMGRKLFQQKLQGGIQHKLNINASAQPLVVNLKNQNGSLSRKLFWSRK